MSLEQDIEDFIPTIGEHVRAFFAARAPQFERGIRLAEMAQSDPGIEALETAVGITAPARAAFGEYLKVLDAEFVRVAQEATANGRAAGHAAAVAELAPPAPEVPAEVEPPAEVPPAE